MNPDPVASGNFFLYPDPELFVSDSDPGRNEEKKITNKNLLLFCFKCTENIVEYSFNSDSSWLILLNFLSCLN